jgi:hypothetical protein
MAKLEPNRSFVVEIDVERSARNDRWKLALRGRDLSDIYQHDNISDVNMRAGGGDSQRAPFF